MAYLSQAEPSFMIPGPVGNIEAVLTQPQTVSASKKAIAIVCHPHPLFGGTMTNKVVTTLVRVMTDIGLPALRFNFRGVGKSEGTFAEGVGEVADLLAVIAWLNNQYPEHKIWLAGFSFGAAVCATAATQTPVAQLITVAPPVPRFNLLNLPEVTCPWVVVQGDHDDVVNPEDVFAWVLTRKPQPVLIKMAEAGHFFHGRLLELRELLENVL